jgi:hypothetical protein
MESKYRKKPYQLLKELNPKFRTRDIMMILSFYMNSAILKISRGSIINVTLHGIGTVKTHGARKKKLGRYKRGYFKKYQKKMTRKKREEWTDDKLIY